MDRNTQPSVSSSLNSSQVQVTVERHARADLGNWGGSVIGLHRQSLHICHLKQPRYHSIYPRLYIPPPTLGQHRGSRSCRDKLSKERIPDPNNCVLTGSTLTQEGAPEGGDCFLLEGIHLDQLILIIKSYPWLLAAENKKKTSKDLPHIFMLFSKLLSQSQMVL